MPQVNPNEARNRDLVNSLTKQLRELCVDLYEKRCSILLPCYGTAFDDRPDCMLIIGMPSEPPYAAPTTCIIHREAKFVLDSEESESEMLDTVWRMLHRLIAADGDRPYLPALEALNSQARQRVLACKYQVMDSMPALFKMLDDDCYTLAFQYAESVFGQVGQTFDEIISSYSLAALPSD